MVRAAWILLWLPLVTLIAWGVGRGQVYRFIVVDDAAHGLEAARATAAARCSAASAEGETGLAKSADAFRSPHRSGMRSARAGHDFAQPDGEVLPLLPAQGQRQAVFAAGQR